LAGGTYREIASKHNLSKATIHYILQDDEIKDVIQTGTKEMINMVPKAIDNYKMLLESDDQAIVLKASKDTLQTTGIMPSHTQNQVIYNIFNQSNTVINPEVLNILSNHEQQPIIDVDLGLDV
jgi:hypothetical protein